MDHNGGFQRRSRRAVLRVGALVAATTATAPLAACGLFDDGKPERTGPDLVTPLIGNALALAAQHEAAIASFPELTDRLTPITQAHRSHAVELARVTGTGLPSGAPVASTAVASASAEETLTALRTAEQQGRDTAVTACVGAPSDRAALVGSIAAARATHAEVLR